MGMNSEGEDWWWEGYLDRNYGGAPDECTYHFIQGQIIKLVDGKCPECDK